MAKTQKSDAKRKTRVGDAAFLLCRHLPAAPAGRQTAGIISAYITPDGITVIRFSCWRRVVQHAQQLRHKGASPAEVVAYITRKANELEAKWGWLKRLWAARLQRVLRRLALQREMPTRWDGKDDDLALPEALCVFAALQVSPKECRAPPNDLDAPLKPLSPRWLTPAIPSFCRAPTPCLRVAGISPQAAGRSFLTEPVFHR
jgi:hypothetical protein